MMAEKKKYCFLFGAGAETAYGLPSGAEYTLNTMLSKRNKMYEALKAFYKNEVFDNYAKDYREEFMFQETSNAFYEIVERALEVCETKDDLDSNTNAFLKKWSKGKRKSEQPTEFKNQLSELYKEIIIDIDTSPNVQQSERKIDQNTKYRSLLDEFSYYGSIEKDFATIINPKEAGPHRFWRLVNYFWSAWFSIMLPLLEFTKHQEKLEKAENSYSYVLDNLQEIISDVYDGDLKGESSQGYYSILREAFPNSTAITTNYTPFEENYWEHAAYLAGRLYQFEIPEELRLINLRDANSELQGCVFPYLATQAPVKPIIAFEQLDEYRNAMDYITNCDYLVIVGYGVNNADNHINALLRYFLTSGEGKGIIYCAYVKENESYDEKKERTELIEKLRITNYAQLAEKIIVLPNYGNAEKLAKLIKEVSSEIHMEAIG